MKVHHETFSYVARMTQKHKIMHDIILDVDTT